MTALKTEDLVKKLFKLTEKTDAALLKLRHRADKINDYYLPRNRFNRWRDSSEGKAWKEAKWLKQKQCCAECHSPIPLRGAHIDHIQPISKFPELAVDIKNLRITCPDCNQRKGNRTS
jgi:5-methylcytosine-specific restriction endonuclease McrA